jgi:hypothetical protein
MHNEKLNGLQLSPNITEVIKLITIAIKTKETETEGMVMKTWLAETRRGWEDDFI